jgi:diguanylate cyclase
MNPPNNTHPTGPVAEAATQPLASASLAASDLAFGDIDTLFHAIHGRIASAAGDDFIARCIAHGDDPAARLRVVVLECAAELKQLHLTMTTEVGHRRLLERIVDDLQCELANVRAELAGTKLAERVARHQALHDGLTLLPNAEYFRTRVDNALVRVRQHEQPVALLFLDLDGFKAINDTHGHATGDAVLRIVAARLVGGIRAEDLVSRVGGDEFACLLVGVQSRAHLGRLVCQMFDSVAGPLTVGRISLSVRASIGIAMAPADGTTSVALMKHADAAMYRAKRQKRGYVFFDEPADAAADDATPERYSSVFDRLTLNGFDDPADATDAARAPRRANPAHGAQAQP